MKALAHSSKLHNADPGLEDVRSIVGLILVVKYRRFQRACSGTDLYKHLFVQIHNSIYIHQLLLTHGEIADLAIDILDSI